MKKAEIISALLVVFVTAPIWFFLLHEVLESVNATDLMWFLYWVYVPVAVFVSLLTNITKGK